MADNSTNVSLNGNQPFITGNVPGQCEKAYDGPPVSGTTTSGLVPGINTLTFNVDNCYPAAGQNPTGLDFVATVTFSVGGGSGGGGPDPSGSWGLVLFPAPVIEVDSALTIGNWNPTSSTFTGSGRLLGEFVAGGFVPRRDAIGLTGQYVSRASCGGIAPCVTLSLKLPGRVTVSLTGGPGNVPPCGLLASYCWEGTGSDNHGGRYLWEACRNCSAQLPSSVLKRFAQSEVQSYDNTSDLLGSIADDGAGSPTPLGEALDKIGTTLQFLSYITGGDSLRVYADPPDQNFRSIAQPRFIRQIRVPRVFPSGERKVLQAWIDSARKATGFLHAFRVSLERAEGAMAAHDGAWTLRQLVAAAGFARNLATALRREAATLTKLSRDLRRPSQVNPSLSVKTVKRIQSQIKHHGFPRAMRLQLKTAGASPSEIAALRAALLRAPPRTLAGRVFDHFTAGAYVNRLKRFAAGLESYAAALAHQQLS